MSSHELARQLLKGPDVPVVTGLDRCGYGEPVEDVRILSAHPFSDEKNLYLKKREKVVELVLSESSSHSSTPGT